ncbi:hypothetical protein [Azospirillum rugosum]|uniref:Uncharacterized protein n=1 Tax=Azospirillum rugosum TaxID=416170 RepID=A0ABS4SRQ2_9PROT|nr:hypothetical protein [Azospirillum rugosum]MBP2294773.1 hypothetical protein [Azospirillum rugosum]MDQ0527938.1 hypothetical protein [Azospirillum rugosum]
MMRIVNLSRTGLFVVMRSGALASLAGRTHWRSLDEVWSAARSENVPVSDFVVRTAAA